MTFAKTVSFLSNPFIVLIVAPYVFASFEWAVFSYLFLIAIVLFIRIGMIIGFFSDFDISRKEQRPILYWFAGFIAFLYLLSLLILNGPKILMGITFSIILGMIISLIINKIWVKVSIHLAMISGFLTALVLVYGEIFFLSFLLIPFVAWSRVKLKAHTLPEAITGAILGCLTILTVYSFNKYLFN